MHCKGWTIHRHGRLQKGSSKTMTGYLGTYTGDKDDYTGYPFDEYLSKYYELGGKATRDEYFRLYEIFLDHTLDIQVFGDHVKYDNRLDAWEGAKKEMKVNEREVGRVFGSIDEVTAYT